MEDFVHLNVHTHFSIGGGLSRVRELVDKAIGCGMRGMAITDYGNMFGIQEFHDYVKRINHYRQGEGLEPFKPIIGCEIKIVHGLKENRNGTRDSYGYNLTVLAKNLKGYRNLVKIVSNANVDGWYYKPRTDRVDLEKYHDGLIVCSGDMGGEVAQMILNSKEADLREIIEWYHNLFGDDYYFELQRHEVKDPSIRANRKTFGNQEQINNVLIRLAKEYNIKLVATNDVSFTNEDDAEAHDFKICVDTDRRYNNSDRPVYYTKQEWLKSREEMNEVFHDIPEALASTIEILNKIDYYSIDHDEVLPSFPVPENNGSSEEYLDYLVYAGANRIYGERLSNEVLGRLSYELGVIKQKGFADYFLIIQDIINHARNEMGMIVSPGRGSVSGCLVAYCMGITKIDPLKHDLLFERFLNVDDKRLPHIGIDIDEEGLERLYDWIVDKYGVDNCARLIAYKTHHNLRKGPKQFTQALKGLIKDWDIDPRFFIMSKGPVSDWLPIIQVPREDNSIVRCTQYYRLRSTGLVEMDFMGQRILSVLKEACTNIRQKYNSFIDLDAIPADDPKTIELLQRGNTEHVYLFHAKAMQQHLRDLHPTNLDQLAALYALYRYRNPKLRHYIARKNGKEKIEYANDCEEKCLKDTFGLGIYEEQLMLMSQQIASFTEAESKELNKALWKRLPLKLNPLEQSFLERGKNNGYGEEYLKSLWNEWYDMPKTGYRFLKAQAVSYAWLAYQSAYLKANYPVEYQEAISRVRMRRSDYIL